MLAKAHSSMQAFLPSHLKKKKKSAVSIIKHFKALLKHAVGKPSKCLNFNRLLKGPLKSAEEVCGASTAEPLKARPRDTRWALGEENHSKNWSGGWEKSTKKVVKCSGYLLWKSPFPSPLSYKTALDKSQARASYFWNPHAGFLQRRHPMRAPPCCFQK